MSVSLFSIIRQNVHHLTCFIYKVFHRNYRRVHSSFHLYFAVYLVSLSSESAVSPIVAIHLQKWRLLNSYTNQLGNKRTRNFLVAFFNRTQRAAVATDWDAFSSSHNAPDAECVTFLA